MILENLIEECSNSLYELEGKDSNIGKRTVQLDLQIMRSDKLGYNAPIEVYLKKYYRYSNSDFSITNIPLTRIDMEVLTESVELLKQFKKLSLFKELNGVIQKLEDKVYNVSNNQSPIIHLDKNENLKGLEHLDKLYQAILKRIVLRLTYQSFSANSASTFNFHGYILKEFNNRWFLVGKRHGETKITTLALDRIIKVDIDLGAEFHEDTFDPDVFYANTYGVTVLTDVQLINIELKVDRNNVPYLLTKPIHSSQRLLEEFNDGSIIVALKVHHNFEIVRLLLGFGGSIEILKPESLRNQFKQIFKRALTVYEGN